MKFEQSAPNWTQSLLQSLFRAGGSRQTPLCFCPRPGLRSELLPLAPDRSSGHPPEELPGLAPDRPPGRPREPLFSALERPWGRPSEPQNSVPEQPRRRPPEIQNSAFERPRRRPPELQNSAFERPTAAPLSLRTLSLSGLPCLCAQPLSDHGAVGPRPWAPPGFPPPVPPSSLLRFPPPPSHLSFSVCHFLSLIVLPNPHVFHLCLIAPAFLPCI
ncbi:unnamed protein product [Pleuronectes platessa]|uniref:Uncharacterized protein n=1 Tax=Pleuronectes platessa TaxID=8262 RepID=A0A9N7YXG7_PLEPL|nr:unnamed protein product [Pleuronectes platessa]